MTLTSAATAILLGVLRAAVAQEGAPPMTRTGEPYELAGNRLVFTNWHYIRPGGFGWYDDQGNNITVSGSVGPWGAQLRHTDYPHGIRLVVQPAQRRGPIVVPERPWEAKGVQINTLLQDGGKLRAWGSCTSEAGTGYACFLESTDGATWERPDLGLCDFEGSTANNLLGQTTVGTVFLDPSAPPEERYKWVDLQTITREEFDAFRARRPDAWEARADRADVGQIYAVVGAVSADGLRWTRLPEPLVVEHSDTQPVCMYDERLGRYVLYTRNWSVGERSAQAPDDRGLSWMNVGRRSIGRSESTDFRQFPLSEIVLEPGPELLPSDTLYTNCKTTIPGAPDHHLLFPTIWHTGDDTTSVVLASSRDNRVWHYLPGPPVLETAPFGEWDGGCVFARPNLVELPDGSFALPYTGYLFPHKYPRGQWQWATGLAVWPKGRLVALEAEDRGEFATVGLVPRGRKLLINALTQRAGTILVEVADLGGTPLPGRSFAEADPVIGDQFRTPLTWQGQDDLGFEAGAAIILRFRLEQAKLFGLEFG